MGELTKIAWRSKSRPHLVADLARELLRTERSRIDTIRLEMANRARRGDTTPAWTKSTVIFAEARRLIAYRLDTDRVAAQLVDDVIGAAVAIFCKRREREGRRKLHIASTYTSYADRATQLSYTVARRYGWSHANYTGPTYYPGLRAWSAPRHVMCLTVDGPFQLRGSDKNRFRGLGDELAALIQAGHTLRMIRQGNHRLLEFDGKIYTLPQLLIEHCGYRLDQTKEGA